MGKVKESLDILFSENTGDQNKSQDYKEHFQEYELPEKYYLMEMYQKQKELQTFLAERGRTQSFPKNALEVKQSDVQLAIYHLFCMQIEYQELITEVKKLAEIENFRPEVEGLDARYELIDMFFFMFNVGIYTGIDMLTVINTVEEYNNTNTGGEYPYKDILSFTLIDEAITNLMNYIDKLPWKAWKQYDYATLNLTDKYIIGYYANAVRLMVSYAKVIFDETDKSLFDLYMNKWEENRRRQIDINSGYNVLDVQQNSDNNDQQTDNVHS